jgi:hypothetical protein
MSATTLVVVWGSASVDAALAAWCLFRRPPARVGPARVLLALVLTTALFLVKGLAAVGVLRSLFLMVHLAYVDTVVVLPALGLAALAVSRRREVAASVRALAGLALLLAPIGVWGTFVEPFRLVTEQVEVPLAAARAGTAPLRIGVLSDLQFREVTDHEREAVARVVALAPDLILLPGDLVQVGRHEFDARIPAVRELLAPLRAPLGVWFVPGNCDHTPDLERLFEGTGIRLLENRVVRLEHGDREVTLAGVDLSFRSQPARETLRRMEEEPGEGDLRLLVAHRPDVLYELAARTRVDLIVAGHTHGGQVSLPLIGPPITLSWVPRSIAAGGLHEHEGRRIYVSRGIGCERGKAPRVRFNCPPEVTLLTLTSEAGPQGR